MKISKRLKFLLTYMGVPIYSSLVVALLGYLLGVDAGTLLLILSTFSIGCIVMLTWTLLMGFIITVRKI